MKRERLQKVNSSVIRSKVLVSYDTEQAKNNVAITIDNQNSAVTEVAKEQTVALDSIICMFGRVEMTSFTQ